MITNEKIVCYICLRIEGAFYFKVTLNLIKSALKNSPIIYMSMPCFHACSHVWSLGKLDGGGMKEIDAFF